MKGEKREGREETDCGDGTTEEENGNEGREIRERKKREVRDEGRKTRGKGEKKKGVKGGY